MIFAQAATEIPGYLNVVLQTGALGILAYHFLWGLPALFEKVNANHKMLIEMIFGDSAADRSGFEIRVKLIAEEIKKIREEGKCKYQP